MEFKGLQAKKKKLKDANFNLSTLPFFILNNYRVKEYL